MAVRENKAIAIGPNGVLRIEAQKLLPQAVGDRSQGHWRARMSRVGRLDCVHRQCADGVDAQRIEIGFARHDGWPSRFRMTRVDVGWVECYETHRAANGSVGLVKLDPPYLLGTLYSDRINL